MNSEWQTFLAEQGVTGEGAAGEQHPLQLPEAALCDLSSLGLVVIDGEDALPFLQGQLTNEVRQLPTNQWGVGAYCSPKGRMIADFRILRLAERVVLQLPAATQALLLKRLPMFVLMAKVKIAEASAELTSFGAWGDAVGDALRAQLGELPSEPGALLAWEGGAILRLAGEPSRWLLVGQSHTLQPLWQAVAPVATITGFDSWQLLEIRAGYPSIQAATSEAFVPQMCNLQLLGGISFTKGCFVGQEVVARMKYLGKLKRRMYYATVTCEQRPQPGDELFSAASSSGQGAGSVVVAAPSPAGGYELLVVCEIAAFEQGTLHLLGQDGPLLTLRPPPYGFEE